MELQHRLSYIVELNVDLFHAYGLEDHARVRYNIRGINVLGYFQLDGTHKHIRTKRPKVRLLYRIDAGQTGHLLVTLQQ